MLTCTKYLNCSGITASSTACSRGLGCDSGSPSTIPSLTDTRHTWVSTGRTGRASEYMSTHRAVLIPTPGRERRKDSASDVGSCRRKSKENGGSVARSLLRIATICSAFFRPSPPVEITAAISSELAFASDRQVWKRRRSAAYVLRYKCSGVAALRIIKINSANGSVLL